MKIIPIPQPKPLPLLGNMRDVNPNTPIMDITAISRKFDGIYRLEFPMAPLIAVSSQELVAELCDESRFEKRVHLFIKNLRPLADDGLFTAETADHNWGKAHRVLTPAFGPLSLKKLYPTMLDIAEQMLTKWERYGDEHIIDVSDDMTRLTLDTIALASFDYRFNSFYEQELHPFVAAMIRNLRDASDRNRRPDFVTNLMVKSKRIFENDIKYMQELARNLIIERKKKGPDFKKEDLLHYMLNSVDPVSGEKLLEQNIIYQLVTFLIAGHETTSGMLTFTIYELLKNPQVLAKLQKEIDDVLGSRIPTFDDLPKLTYLDQVFKESLRLWPTAPAFGVQPLEEKAVIGGKYEIMRKSGAMIILPALHRDPKVWTDPDKFEPDRMRLDKFRALPPHAWKPFGNGERACIGRGFAMAEATLAIAMMLQRFDIEFVDPKYKLKIKETLTLKPEGLMIRARRRNKVITHFSPVDKPEQELERKSHNKTIPLQILYGSNTGSSETFVKRIAKDTEAAGHKVTLGTLDSSIDQISKEGLVVIVTASYEGKPPHNARKFIKWLENRPANSLQGVKYVIFGCGNTDWSQTYQSVPRSIDSQLTLLGAERLMDRGEGNAAGDLSADFEKWYGSLLKQLS